MSFITLARELGSISEADVIRLSKSLGMDCIGKEFVEKRFDEIGITRDSLREYDEKKPGFFSKILKAIITAITGTLATILGTIVSDKVTGKKRKSTTSTTGRVVKNATSAATRTITKELTRDILGNLK